MAPATEHTESTGTTGSTGTTEHTESTGTRSGAGPEADGADVLGLAIRLSRAQAALAKRFDRALGGWHGLSFSDFILLAELDRAPERRLRRIDLAEAVGLSASGVTRALAPLERIGLVSREVNPRDARVAFATLTEAGVELVRDVDASARRVAENVFAGPDWQPDERVVLHDLLGRLVY